jgi:probable F420-dependent oxidoreductase
MRFALGLPTTSVDAPEEFLTGAAIAEMARTAEALGFEAVYVTDHPAGDQKWLETGGHHALDPFVALSFAAAATTRLRVQTHILVLPYRNPFLAAKSVLSLDVLSAGRLTLGVAAGYLRSEFNALGVDYDERNALFDEALDVIRLALTDDSVAYVGRHFRSRGTTMRPRPAQQPHPPMWIGGNSMRAMRRAVESAQGWCPFPNPAAAAAATKTPKLETLDELAARVAAAREHGESIGRTEPLDICFAPMGLTMFGGRNDDDALRAEIQALAELGVTQVPVEVSANTRVAWLQRAERLAETLMP